MERMYFIGVSTTGSRIMDLFPRWAKALDLEAELVGIDLPLGAGSSGVRAAIETIVDDPAARGGLVTTHKVTVAQHSGDFFVELDDWARRCSEISCIAKRNDGLHGSAKDPVTSWKAFVDIAGTDYFDRHPQAEVLCLGAGGSGTAFTSQLLTVDHPPARIQVTNRSPTRLEFLAGVHAGLDSDVEIRYHPVNAPEDNDRVLESLPPHSVVANATGMGKDRPGSPVSDTARFPLDGVAWEFNYRGGLEFLHQARSQPAERRLRVEDGWRYFLYGWSDHMSEIFGLIMETERFEHLAGIAEDLRPG